MTDYNANLLKLAEYLETLPTTHFDMTDYVRGVSLDLDYPHSTRPHLNECGTVACAVGHAVAIFPTHPDQTWSEFAEETFGVDAYSDENLFGWMFGSGWTPIDNTPAGAAKRIRYYLENSVPKGFSIYCPNDEYVAFMELYQ